MIVLSSVLFVGGFCYIMSQALDAYANIKGMLVSLLCMIPLTLLVIYNAFNA